MQYGLVMLAEHRDGQLMLVRYHPQIAAAQLREPPGKEPIGDIHKPVTRTDQAEQAALPACIGDACGSPQNRIRRVWDHPGKSCRHSRPP